jgi:catechol 2,3-dioxygenase-like lactoylglutathione lyase family enzyme
LSVSVKGIDHLVIRVSDLDASETAYRKLGFTLTPRGFHAGRGSANHTAPLSSGNYFELLHLPPGGDADAFPDREGPVAIALSPLDSRTIYAEITALGYDVEPPRDLSRPVHLPEGVREARFLNASFPRIEPETVRWFACQHLTRDLVWRPEWEAHANGADRLLEAIVVHPSPVRLRATFTKLFGEAVRYDAERLTIKLGEDEVSFISPGAFQARFPAIRLPAELSEGWFAGAVFRVGSLGRLEGVLSRAGINFSRTPVGSIVVASSEGAGAVLEFVAPS